MNHTPNTEQRELAEFEAWWAEHGQFCRAGGGDYEKTFAYRAWQAARATQAAPAEDRQPEYDPDAAQHWDKLDGATAWHVIDRHADNWGEIGAQMEAWGRARFGQAAPASPNTGAVPGRGTVGEVRATLAPFADNMPINAAFFVDFDGKRACRVKPLIISRERVLDGKWIKTGDQSVPYSLIAWANQDERATPSPSKGGEAEDGERLRFAMQDIDGFGKLVMDKYDYAIQIAEEHGRDVPTAEDELNGIRRLIDAAMQPQGAGGGDE